MKRWGCRWALAALAAASACGGGAGSDAGLLPDSGLPSDGGKDAGGPDSGLPGALRLGVPCQGDDQCQSGICGVAGSGGGGHCCGARCIVGNQGCGANDCDGLGNCFYPPQATPCGAAQCLDGGVVTNSCDGQGQCRPQPATACPGHFACANPLACLNSCRFADGGGCGPGYQCASNTYDCIPQAVFGYCAGDRACLSGQCLNHTCCATACLTGDPSCGATACDLQTGACLYPPTTQSCGTPNGCSGSALTGPYCDAKGGCDAAVNTQPCAGGFACADGGELCNAFCQSNSECAATSYCAPLQNCCPRLAPGTTLTVDAQIGLDQDCCGAPETPCNSITFAMAQVAASEIPGVTLALKDKAINPFWGGGAPSFPEWRPLSTPHGETYPIHLGWGVTVSGQNVAFNPPNNGTVFEVYAYPGEADAGPVSIVSPAGFPQLVLGVIPAFSANSESTVVAPPVSKNVIGIDDDVPNTRPLDLHLANLEIAATATGLRVGPGANVTLGPASVLFGPVNLSNAAVSLPGPIGGSSPAINVACGAGIRCRGSATAQSQLSDLPSSDTVVWVTASSGPALDVNDRCSVSLTQDPVLYGGTDGVRITGPGSVQLGAPGTRATGVGSYPLRSTIVGPSNDGIELWGSDAGAAPRCQVYGLSIASGGCAGVAVNDGTFTAVNSAIEGYLVGVLTNGGQADLSGGSLGSDGGNVICGYGPANPAGPSCAAFGLLTPAGLLNLNPASVLNGDNLQLASWDSAQALAEVWSCQAGYLGCQCNGANGCSGPLDFAGDGGASIAPAPDAIQIGSANISLTNATSAIGCP